MNPINLIRFDAGISAIDTYFQRPMMAASHIIVDDGEAAFVDVGTKFSVPYLIAALERLGLSREAVKYVIVTHIHLDHAGGAGQLMEELPNATFVVHPRGGRHMVDPSKLWAGALQVYGQTEMHATYGELSPIPQTRVLEMPHESELTLGNRTLKFLHTLGHAKHHFCIWDSVAKSFFTGDTFGLSYREFDSDNGPFLFPTTTPVHFDPGAMHDSVDCLMSHKPQAMYLTHFSRIPAQQKLASSLHHQIDELTTIAENLKDHPNRHQALCDGVQENLLTHIEAHGSSISKEKCLEVLAIDIDLNAQGLAVWLDSKH